MMRDIKFRAWMPSSKIMVPWETLRGYTAALVLENPKGIPMQFTGLKDKNGREIYEGDILTTSNAEGTNDVDVWDAEEYGRAVVSIDFHGVHFRPQNGFGWSWDEEESVYALAYCEVIGNIYENPELVGEAKS